MIELPFPMQVPSHRAAVPYQKQEPITLPPPNVVAQTIDAVLKDPALASELRSRGMVGKRPYDPGRGSRWVANRDGHCMKAVGWEITDAGVLRPRECSAPIPKGTECWRRGWYFYGIGGCHDKSILLVPKLFVGEHVMNSTEFANNLPDRKRILGIVEALWNIEVEAGNITGEWGSEDRKASEARSCATVLDGLRTLKRGVELPLKYAKPEGPKRQRKEAKPKKEASFQPVQVPDLGKPKTQEAKRIEARRKDEDKRKDKDGLIVEKPATPAPLELRGVIRRFAGASAQVLAESFARGLNEARVKSGMQPLTTHAEGTQWVVINPDLIAPSTTPDPKVVKGKGKRKAVKA